MALLVGRVALCLFVQVELLVRSVRVRPLVTTMNSGRIDRAAVWDGEWGGKGNSVLDGRAHWRHMANEVE